MPTAPLHPRVTPISLKIAVEGNFNRNLHRTVVGFGSNMIYSLERFQNVWCIHTFLGCNVRFEALFCRKELAKSQSVHASYPASTKWPEQVRAEGIVCLRLSLDTRFHILSRKIYGSSNNSK